MSAVYIPHPIHYKRVGKGHGRVPKDAACGNCLIDSNHGRATHGLKRSGAARPSGFLVPSTCQHSKSARCQVGHEPIKDGKTCAVTTAADKSDLTTWTASWSVLKSGPVVEAKMRAAVVKVSMFLSKFREGNNGQRGQAAADRADRYLDSGYLELPWLQVRSQVLL